MFSKLFQKVVQDVTGKCGWGLCEEKAVKNLTTLRACGHDENVVPSCQYHAVTQLGKSRVAVECPVCGEVNYSTAI